MQTVGKYKQVLTFLRFAVKVMVFARREAVSLEIFVWNRPVVESVFSPCYCLLNTRQVELSFHPQFSKKYFRFMSKRATYNAISVLL